MTTYQEYHLMMAYARDGERFNANLPPGCVACDYSYFAARAAELASIAEQLALAT